MNSIYSLFIGRLLLGIYNGANFTFIPMYMREFCPINLRGTVGSIHGLFIGIGILFSQCMSLGLDTQVEKNLIYWRILLGIGVIFLILRMTFIYFIY